MNIAFVVYGSLEAITGGNLYDGLIASGLRDRGHRVEILSLPSGHPLHIAMSNIRFRPPTGLDVLVQDELTHASLLLPNRRRHALPIVSIVHNLHSMERRPTWQNSIHRILERTYLNSVDGIVVNSEATLDSIRLGLGIEKPFRVVLPGGDRLGGLNLDQVVSRASEGGPLRLVFLANVTAVKGLDILLKALARLDPGSYALDVVGSCQMQPEYARAMRKQALRLGSQVRVRGILDGATLVEALTRAQVMVIPSFYEGFGIAYAEGMAFGLPAIGTTVGAIPALIQDGVNGYLVPPGDEVALANRISTLIGNRTMLAGMSAAALASAGCMPRWADGVGAFEQFLLRFTPTRI